MAQHFVMASATNIKFLQANMDHTRDATKLLVDYMTREGFAFAIVSDPYTRGDKIPHVPHSMTPFHAPVAPRVMLLARAPGFDLFPLYVSQHAVAVGCESAGQAFIVIATYAPPHRLINPILHELSQYFSRYSSINFILADDFDGNLAIPVLSGVCRVHSSGVRILSHQPTGCRRVTATAYPSHLRRIRRVKAITTSRERPLGGRIPRRSDFAR
ncbi:hypothetical protein HPB49_004238 [Dermacentor silvarum]|uniref:Uncharacterized protein n=1 Tax=Dermacentor silvarum TaxID=543639 RepID=A0ACB8CPQ3_DERSI|nr:hypothetical protein HPB49_004238 [Dermacentor silvarum]